MFYFIMLLIMTMFTLNPVIITVSFVMALLGVLRHKGTGALKMTQCYSIPDNVIFSDNTFQFLITTE